VGKIFGWVVRRGGWQREGERNEVIERTPQRIDYRSAKQGKTSREMNMARYGGSGTGEKGHHPIIRIVEEQRYNEGPK
jgi:hypothetical protein